MPHCITCNPNCQMCHNKPTLKMPAPCPNCGRYNVPDTICKRCGTMVPEPPAKKAGTKKGSGMCFRCDPLKNPLCKQCLAQGRIVKCLACEALNLAHRKDCKYCGADLSDLRNTNRGV